MIRSARFDHEFNKKIDRAIKEGGFSSPSASIRSAVEHELAGRDNGLQDAEDRIAASLDRVAREIRSVRLGQQAMFAFMDALVKTILTCLAEPPLNAASCTAVGWSIIETVPPATRAATARYVGWVAGLRIRYT